MRHAKFEARIEWLEHVLADADRVRFFLRTELKEYKKELTKLKANEPTKRKLD